MNYATIQRYFVPIVLAIPVAALATGDFIIAVNVQWGWKSEADAAPVSIPIFVLLWISLSFIAIAAGDMKRGALRLALPFIVFSLCLPLAITIQAVANDVRDPIIPPILILIATTIFITAPMVVCGILARQGIAREIERDEHRLPAPNDWDKKRKVAGLLLLLGLFGIHGLHRIYVGKTVMGLLMLLTFGGLFIWSLFDLAAMLRGRFTDCYGTQLTTTKGDVVVMIGVFAVPLVLAGSCFLL